MMEIFVLWKSGMQGPPDEGDHENARHLPIRVTGDLEDRLQDEHWCLLDGQAKRSWSAFFIRSKESPTSFLKAVTFSSDGNLSLTSFWNSWTFFFRISIRSSMEWGCSSWNSLGVFVFCFLNLSSASVNISPKFSPVDCSSFRRSERRKSRWVFCFFPDLVDVFLNLVHGFIQHVHCMEDFSPCFADGFALVLQDRFLCL